MNALAHILSSRVKAEIFRLLFGLIEQPLHLREIERRAGLAVSTVRQELQNLIRLGLVEKSVDGNRRLYIANRHHPLYPDIRNLVLKTSGLADILREALEPTPAVRMAFIFGSLARNEEKAESDLDLMVIGSITLRQLAARLSGVAEKIGREITRTFSPLRSSFAVGRMEITFSRLCSQRPAFSSSETNMSLKQWAEN